MVSRCQNEVWFLCRKQCKWKSQGEKVNLFSHKVNNANEKARVEKWTCFLTKCEIKASTGMLKMVTTIVPLVICNCQSIKKSGNLTQLLRFQDLATPEWAEKRDYFMFQDLANSWKSRKKRVLTECAEKKRVLNRMTQWAEKKETEKERAHHQDTSLLRRFFFSRPRRNCWKQSTILIAQTFVALSWLKNVTARQSALSRALVAAGRSDTGPTVSALLPYRREPSFKKKF